MTNSPFTLPTSLTMAPGFDPIDYAIGDREKLIKQYPEQSDLITRLTRVP